MAFLLLIGSIIALSTFVAILMMDPADTRVSKAPAQAEPEPAPADPQVVAAPIQAMEAARTPRLSRMEPVFFEQIGRRPVVVPENVQPARRSPYIVDLSNQDARKN